MKLKNNILKEPFQRKLIAWCLGHWIVIIAFWELFLHPSRISMSHYGKSWKKLRFCKGQSSAFINLPESNTITARTNSGKTMKLWFKSHKGHEPKLFKSKKLCNLIRFQGGTDYGKTIHGVFTNNRTINLLIRHGWVSLCAIIGGFQLLV